MNEHGPAAPEDPAASRPPRRRSRWLPRVLALAVVLVVGTADFLTGHELLFSSFYLLAVGTAAWMTGPGFATLVAVLSVGAWLLGDIAAGAVYPHAFVPAWNAGIILALYLVVVWLVVRLRNANRFLEARVRERTRALTEEILERERLEREVLDVGERERRRIGRDLHDSLGQLLTGTALAGQVLHEKLQAGAASEAGDAARIVGLVEQAIEQTRRLARGLDPVVMDGGGLAQGLLELAERTRELSAVSCEFRAVGNATIEDSVKAIHLYRIAQEAITNAIRHARPSRVVVTLEELPGRVRLSVRDDGCGLPAAPTGRGMGMRIMAHRAAVMQGTFEARSAPGGGTLVTSEVPCP